MHLSHPFRITLCEVIVHGNDMYPSSFQCIQISRERGYKGLTFTGLHLRDTSLMENNAADQLYPVMLHV